ncbi:tripartite tricarboxylate transporter TctB family protein [Neogemmobacter tilapiae]|uniref:Membrane protein n=1 Tax=Neogemmobacter tilapiae TaxID=875041 RepID=A0A918TKC4_9RHOB|nr:tripartite tricarboxylate transporter TctB family protein [Gemmobacter tilapiae]GHC51018.1 membrane protein [Gemmobacter tilapiae]
MTTTKTDRTDAAAGILFIAFGLLFGVQSLGMELGTAFRMGPGYFPLVLSGVLILLGLAILIIAFKKVSATEMGGFAWRGMLFILPAPVFFGLTVRGLGFVPAIFLTTLIAGLASLKMKPQWALVLAFGVTVFSTLVFSYGLGLPFRRFGPWLPL